MNQSNVDVIGMFREIAMKVEKKTEFPPLAPDTKLSALGIDSISMMEIIGEMEDHLDITISDERLAQIQSVGDIQNVVMNRLNERHA